MYQDPRHIRSKRVNLSLNEDEMRAIEAISALNKQQPSAFLRELIIASASFVTVAHLCRYVPSTHA